MLILKRYSENGTTHRQKYGTLFSIGQGPDPCNMYTLIDEPQRDIGFKSQDPKQLLCDRLLKPGWYRFQDAEMVFGTCVKPYQCGTHVPLWIDGKIPDVSK